MHEVVYVDQTRKQHSFREFRTERECWNHIKSQLLHPKKATRQVAQRLFVRKPTGALVPRMPYDVKRLLGL